MTYDDESVFQITTQYSLLKFSLEKLQEARGDKNGAVLGYVASRYNSAENALNFLKSESVPLYLQERLEIKKLESELLNFGNMHIKL